MRREAYNKKVAEENEKQELSKRRLRNKKKQARRQPRRMKNNRKQRKPKKSDMLRMFWQTTFNHSPSIKISLKQIKTSICFSF